MKAPQLQGTKQLHSLIFAWIPFSEGSSRMSLVLAMCACGKSVTIAPCLFLVFGRAINYLQLPVRGDMENRIPLKQLNETEWNGFGILFAELWLTKSCLSSAPSRKAAITEVWLPSNLSRLFNRMLFQLISV